MSKKRKQFQASFKSRVVLESFKEQQTLSELSSRFEIHPNQISNWKRQVKEQLPDIFKKGSTEKTEKKHEELTDRLYKRIGQLEVELDWLKKKIVH